MRQALHTNTTKVINSFLKRKKKLKNEWSYVTTSTKLYCLFNQSHWRPWRSWPNLCGAPWLEGWLASGWVQRCCCSSCDEALTACAACSGSCARSCWEPDLAAAAVLRPFRTWSRRRDFRRLPQAVAGRQVSTWSPPGFLPSGSFCDDRTAWNDVRLDRKRMNPFLIRRHFRSDLRWHAPEVCCASPTARCCSTGRWSRSARSPVTCWSSVPGLPEGNEPGNPDAGSNTETSLTRLSTSTVLDRWFADLVLSRRVVVVAEVVAVAVVVAGSAARWTRSASCSCTDRKDPLHLGV